MRIERLDLRVDPARVAAMTGAELAAAIRDQLPVEVRSSDAADELVARLARQVRAAGREGLR